MLCVLKVRRAPESEENVEPYQLKITSKQAVGGAGGLLETDMGYAHLPALIQTLDDLGVSAETLRDTHAAIELTSADGHWVRIGSNVQIPFEILSQVGFYLEEQP